MGESSGRGGLRYHYRNSGADPGIWKGGGGGIAGEFWSVHKNVLFLPGNGQGTN